MNAACIVYGAMILLFVLFGVLFACGKGQSLIAGYNTASEWERRKYDEKKLLRIMRNGMFALAGCMAVSLIGLLLDNRAILWIGHGLFLAAIIVLVVRANTGAKKK